MNFQLHVARRQKPLHCCDLSGLGLQSIRLWPPSIKRCRGALIFLFEVWTISLHIAKRQATAVLTQPVFNQINKTSKKWGINLTFGDHGRPLGKLTLSVGGLRGGGGGGGWMMTSRSRGSTSPSMPLSVSSGSSSSSRASSFLKGSRSLYVSRLSCLTRGWERERGQQVRYRLLRSGQTYLKNVHCRNMTITCKH